jgi:hypothetical protein
MLNLRDENAQPQAPELAEELRIHVGLRLPT